VIIVSINNQLWIFNLWSSVFRSTLMGNVKTLIYTKLQKTPSILSVFLIKLIWTVKYIHKKSAQSFSSDANFNNRVKNFIYIDYIPIYNITYTYYNL